ncbi:long chain acyl-CoA synthetase 6, peroxisomal-like [Dendrobium catenatum]|uniref:Long chain acyl-CoA synthetase 6, peroxisomal n=1 Tax=Dendrobium catenatum TaxID=906689 RepID=A0A2I0VYH2_9ASPA|nr:long chain acyl-CoA synthetase 6, peroxisomal-like [Dendrobium catenatum]PKU68467.1 Long chain acyl-CoA synthetase 6, peroxisomal [Dendrobium catenatum]
MDISAECRLRKISGHLQADAVGDTHYQLSTSSTSGEFVYGQRYSVVLPEKLQTGKWNVYRSARSPLKLVSRYPEHPDIGTLHDNFVHAVDTFCDHKYLGTRIRADGTVGEYKWMTYGEAGTSRSAIGSGLLYHEVPKHGCIGLYFTNRPEWIIVDHACSAYSYISVPLYDTLGPDAVSYIVNHADIQVIFCVPQTLSNLLSFFHKIPSVHLIVVVGASDVNIPSATSTNQPAIITYSKLLEQDNLKLMDDMAVLRPTVFASVPRLYNRIYAGVMNAVKASGGLRERLFNVAYSTKMQAISNGKKPSPIWDRLVFNKIRDKLGGRIRIMSSGASPLSPDVLEFLKICFGSHIIEGYGMTETSCVISNMDEDDTLAGHVGSPNPACEIKLIDVPEMNYTSEDHPYPRGEICVRGPIIFQGYYKDDEQTKEIVDEEGWLHTGDIGLWLPGGRLKIIDRKKNIFKLAQGEYIAPEKIENVYAKCKFIAQCFVYGDSFKSCLVAVVAVEPEILKMWAATERIQYDSLEQLCSDPRARAAVLAEMDEVGKQAQLRGFEFAKAVTLVLDPFTMENGLLTPTFKIKRPQAKAYFATAIANMYEELSKSFPSPQKSSL